MNTSEMIKAMQAYEDGEVVEILTRDGRFFGEVRDSHIWTMLNEYRIKEKPKTVTLYWYEIGEQVSIHTSRIKLADLNANGPKVRLLKTETIEVSE
jgi:hypothetical protein